jgi:hypothetical protein
LSFASAERAKIDEGHTKKGTLSQREFVRETFDEKMKERWEGMVFDLGVEARERTAQD